MEFSDGGTYGYFIESPAPEPAAAAAMLDIEPTTEEPTTEPTTEEPTAEPTTQETTTEATTQEPTSEAAAEEVIEAFTRVALAAGPPQAELLEAQADELEAQAEELLEAPAQPVAGTLASGGTITLTDGQIAVFPYLPAGAAYTVTEAESPGYVATGTGHSGVLTEFGAKSAFVNTFGTEAAAVAGEKFWDLTGAPDDLVLPEHITVFLMNGDTVVSGVAVRPDAQGRWLYSFIAPKYAPDGTEIAYTIREADIAGYISVVNGSDIVNYYEDNGGEEDPKCEIPWWVWLLPPIIAVPLVPLIKRIALLKLLPLAGIPFMLRFLCPRECEPPPPVIEPPPVIDVEPTPKTGDSSAAMWSALTMLALSGCLAYFMGRKRPEDED